MSSSPSFPWQNSSSVSEAQALYPVCLNLAGRLCVIVGGGRVAERKAGGLLAAGAALRLVSPEATDDLRALAGQNKLEWLRKHYDPADLEGAFLVFAATNDSGVQERILVDARAAGLPVNSADSPEDCDFQVPAVVRRGDLLLTVSTSGASPALSALVRRRLEAEFGGEYALLAALLRAARAQVLAAGKDRKDGEILWSRLPVDDLLVLLRGRRFEEARLLLGEALGRDIDLDMEALDKSGKEHP